VTQDDSTLSAELRRLLEAESKDDPEIPKGAPDRVLGMVRAAAGVATPWTAPNAGPSAAAGTSAGISVKAAVWIAAAAVVAGGGLGAGAVKLLGGGKPEPAEARQPGQVLEPETTRPPDATLADSGSPTMDETSLAPRAERHAFSNPPPNAQDERQLIDGARVALRRGRAHDALVFLMSHERQFPAGDLTEERERLAIEALLAQGRRALAEQRAQRFHRRYPRSGYWSQIEQLLQPE